MALNDGLRISQYAHTAWRLQDGVFAGSPNAISQTSDGYLWIGTQAGLVRFDGIRFVPLPVAIQQALASPHIFSLLGSSDGSLWIGTGVGLARLQDGRLTHFKEGYHVANITEARNGHIWIARNRTANDHDGGICEIANEQLQCHNTKDGVPLKNAEYQFVDLAGNVWAGGEGKLIRWSPNSSAIYPVPGLENVGALDSVVAIAPAPDGAMWVGMANAGPGLGLERLVEGKWLSWTTRDFDSTTLAVSTLLLDHHNALWVGTSNAGLYRLFNGTAEHYQSTDGLSSNTVRNIFEDREGNLWVATANGVDKFRDVRVASFSSHEGLNSDEVQAVVPAHDGTIWLSNDSALEHLHSGVVTSITQNHGLPGREVAALLEDSSQRLWVGVDSGLFVMKAGRFEPIKPLGGQSIGTVTDLFEDTAHDVWAKTVGPDRLLRIRDFQIQKDDFPTIINSTGGFASDPDGGIWLGLKDGTLAHRTRSGSLDVYTFERTSHKYIVNIKVAENGAVFGATAKGVVAWRRGVARTLSTDNGLPCELVSALLTDAHNDLWLYTQCGLIHITDSELQSWWRDGSYHVQFRLFDALDGVNAGFTPFSPQSSVAPDGRLWFANETTAQVIDPANVPLDITPAPVYIEDVLADRRPVAPGGPLQLPAQTRDLAIAYTATEMAIPERVKFRYKLVGHDVDWQDAGTRREAFYTNLGPGTYEFKVTATNHDGVWNPTGASLTLNIAAAWYQTRTFLIFCALLVSLLSWLGYRLRLRRISAVIKLRFEERLTERTRLAQDLHDTLLQTIQGSKMVADDAIESGDPERMAATMRRLSIWLGQAVQEGRAALNSLRLSITESNDLAEGFRRALGELVDRETLTATLTVQGSSRDLHPIARDDVFRIGYEAIKNACVHADAKHLTVELNYSHDLTLHVRDDGLGISASILEQGREGHFGLQGMRERAARIGGTLQIESKPTSGTHVILWIPGAAIYRDLSPDQPSLLRRLGTVLGLSADRPSRP